MTERPRRIRRRRTAGWRLPPDAIYVGRPTRWGNPYVVRPPGATGPEPAHQAPDRAEAVRRYRQALTRPGPGQPTLPSVDEVRRHLAGHDLACWCPLDEPCHADVLLELANAPGQRRAAPGQSGSSTSKPRSDPHRLR